MTHAIPVTSQVDTQRERLQHECLALALSVKGVFSAVTPCKRLPCGTTYKVRSRGSVHTILFSLGGKN